MEVRPPKWNEVRSKRLLIKEYVNRLEGLTEDIIEEFRDTSVLLEDDLMVQEVLTHGRLLNINALTCQGKNLNRCNCTYFYSNSIPIKTV